MDFENITESFYEAAVNPEAWARVISTVSDFTKSDCGSIFLYDEERATQGVSTGDARQCSELYLA